MNNTAKIILAPIRGLTNRAFRQAFHQHIGGIYCAIAPYFTCKNTPPLSEKNLDEVRPELNSLITEPQLLGKDPEVLLEAITQLATCGCHQVNFNCGCPYPMVADKGMGSGLLPHPDRLIPLVEQLIDQSPIPISIKLRLGRFDCHEINQLIELLNSKGLAQVTIHPRIGKQLYTGDVNLDHFESLLPKIKRPICYNGDILFKRDIERLSERFPTIDEWMIGRGILMNLFLAHEIKGSVFSTNEKKLKMQRFVEQLEDYYLNLPNGKSHFLHRQIDLWQYLSFHFSDPHKAFKKIKKAKDIDAYFNSRKEVFEMPLSTDHLMTTATGMKYFC